MERLYGEENTALILKQLENEARFAETNHFVKKNFEDVRRAAAGQEMPGDLDLIKTLTDAGSPKELLLSQAVKGSDKVLNNMMRKRAQLNDSELAKLLASNRQDVADALYSLQKREELGKLMSPAAKMFYQAIMRGTVSSLVQGGQPHQYQEGVL